MANTIHQHGQGDNIAGDKVLGDKVAGDKVVHNNQTNLTELLQSIAALRASAEHFPAERRERVIVDLNEVEAEVQKPEEQRDRSLLKRRLKALLAAGAAIGVAIGGVSEFSDNVTNIGEKLGIELHAEP